MPGDAAIGVGLDELVSAVEELALPLELDQRRDVHRRVLRGEGQQQRVAALHPLRELQRALGIVLVVPAGRVRQDALRVACAATNGPIIFRRNGS